MNIWLPIVTNIIAVTIVLAGIIVGKRSRAYIEISKIFALGGLAVGCHFLIPAVSALIVKIPVFKTMHELEALSAASINATSFALLFLASYLLVTITFGIINSIITKKSRHGLKVAKAVKIKAAGKNKRLARHIEKRPLNILGCVFGAVLGIMISFALFLPTKYIFKDVADVVNKPEITSGYEYTAYGQLDKLTGIDDIIIGE